MASSTNAGRSAASPSSVVARMPSSALTTYRPVVGHDRHRDDLVVEDAPVGGAPRPFLGAQTELVELAAVDAPLGRDQLGGDALVHEALGVAGRR